MTPHANDLFKSIVKLIQSSAFKSQRDVAAEAASAISSYESAVHTHLQDAYIAKVDAAERHAKTVEAGAQLSVSRYLEIVADLTRQLDAIKAKPTVAPPDPPI